MIFTYQPYPVRVVFGYPLVDAVRKEIIPVKERAVWIIASSRFDDLVETLSENRLFPIAGRSRDVVQHVPEEIVKREVHVIKKVRPDLLLSIGGGSATGLAKAIALEYPVPIWAAPTTYSGSEMTNIYGISSSGKKIVGRDEKVLPKTVFYDPSLSENLPKGLAVKSAMNAMAHLIEAVYSTNNNPFSYQNAIQGIRSVYNGMIDMSIQKSMDTEINEKFLLGSCLAGKTLCEVSMALHHKAVHVLGGSFGMDHASVHTVLLPYVFNFQWPHLEKQAKNDFWNIFSNGHPPSILQKTAKKLGAPVTLRELGFQKKDAKKAASQLMALTFDNPAPMNQASLTRLMKNAYDGMLE